jgi:hypothetical protein
MNYVSTAVKSNESSIATNAGDFAPKILDSSLDPETDAYKTFTTLRLFIGFTGIITNLFVLIVMLGFMALKTKV